MKRSYVRGFFRGGYHPTTPRNNDPFTFLLTMLLLIVGLGIVGFIIKSFWFIIAPIVLIILTFYILRRMGCTRRTKLFGLLICLALIGLGACVLIYINSPETNVGLLLLGIALFFLFTSPIIYTIIRPKSYTKIYICGNCSSPTKVNIPRGTPLIGYEFSCTNCNIRQIISKPTASVDSYYTVKSFCPIFDCSHCNYVAYKKGTIPYGKTITCSKCGNSYTHRRP